jgi:hypothetical protein
VEYGNRSATWRVDSISSLFNVLIKSSISKTASFEAKTEILPIDGSAHRD